MAEWLTPYAAVIAAIVVLVLTYLGARHLGLTDLQKAVRAETEVLVLRLKDQIAALEHDNGDLKLRVARLLASELVLLARVDALEQALADQAIARRRRPTGAKA